MDDFFIPAGIDVRLLFNERRPDEMNSCRKPVRTRSGGDPDHRESSEATRMLKTGVTSRG